MRSSRSGRLAWSGAEVVEASLATPDGQVGAAAAAGESQSFIEVRDLVAAYGGALAVRGVRFSVRKGEQLSLLGPSGCGKSTTLRCVAGLETPVSGEIVIDGRVIFSSKLGINVPTERRDLSMVFQSYAIWPHMTVFENIAYGLKVRRRGRQETRQRVEEVLRMVGMEEYIDQPATNLSGGQQQRVALARSYAYVPKALLLDEPLSNLDARLRARMRDELKELQRQFGATTIFVTHDQEEAMAISDRIVVMSKGVIEQEGGPMEIYDTPRTRFVADFIGAANILAGGLVEDPAGGPGVFTVGEATIRCAPRLKPPRRTAEGRHLLAVRTVYPELQRRPQPTQENQWPAQIRRRVLLGDTVNYTVDWPGGELKVHGFPRDLLAEGERVFLHIPAERALPIDADLETAS
ncbi:ABC transporter ATP-binding protein [bacterium]|nr:MAG: ABC transporter ATP-binding protein [bacterium]